MLSPCSSSPLLSSSCSSSSSTARSLATTSCVSRGFFVRSARLLRRTSLSSSSTHLQRSMDVVQVGDGVGLRHRDAQCATDASQSNRDDPGSNPSGFRVRLEKRSGFEPDEKRWRRRRACAWTRMETWTWTLAKRMAQERDGQTCVDVPRMRRRGRKDVQAPRPSHVAACADATAARRGRRGEDQLAVAHVASSWHEERPSECLWPSGWCRCCVDVVLGLHNNEVGHVTRWW